MRLWQWMRAVAWVSGLLLGAAGAAGAAGADGAKPETIAPQRWRAAPQPGLREDLATAQELTLTDVLPGPTRVWTEGPFFAPNPDSETWDAIIIYQNAYMGHKQVVVHDFATGETHKQLINTGEGSTDLTRERFSLHIRPHFYSRGKLFFDAGGPGLMVLVYDPAKNEFVHGERPFGRDVQNGGWAMGGDGMLYGIGWENNDDRRFVPFHIDPEAYEVERFEPFGPANGNRREIYGDAGMEGDWLYAAFGANPWHLIAYNFKTGEGRTLVTTRDITGDHSTIRLTSIEGGLSGSIREPAEVHGIDDFDSEQLDFWLRDGELHRRDGDIPPWSDEPAEVCGGRYGWDDQVWFKGAHPYWGDFRPGSDPPEIDKETIGPDADGNVHLRYRADRQEQMLRFHVDRYPGVTRHMTEIDHRRIFATDEGYGQAVTFDLNEDETRRMGDLEGLSTYSMTRGPDGLYVSGYPSSRLWRFDFDRPFTLEQTGATDSIDEAPEDNPREVAVLGDHSDVHMPLCTVAATDGRIYSAGTTVERRRRTGGGMAWYDTRTGESGGLWEPFSAYRVFWMTTADDGRYVLLSTKPTEDALDPNHTPEVGRIFCWDTEIAELIYDVPSPGGSVPGPLAEAMDGLVMGHAPAGEGGGVLYGFRADTGEVLWTKHVPARPVTSLSESRRHAWEFRRGPDGNIWTFFGQSLAVIRPRDGHIAVMGKLPERARAAQLAFAGDSVFIAGSYHLRLIEGVQVSE